MDNKSRSSSPGKNFLRVGFAWLIGLNPAFLSCKRGVGGLGSGLPSEWRYNGSGSGSNVGFAGRNEGSWKGIDVGGGILVCFLDEFDR